jgi:uncharacterized protein with GYD domain
MATYLVLNKLTEQGAKNIRNLPQITQGIRADIEGRGGKLHGMYLTQGRYDTALLVEMPDEHEFVAGLLGAVSLGAIHSETLRAYNEEEVQQIVQKISSGPAIPHQQ